MTEVNDELTGQPVSQGIRVYINAKTDAFCTDLVFPNGVPTNGVISLIVGDFSASYSPERCEHPDAAQKVLEQRLVVSCPRLTGKPTCVPVPSSCVSNKSTDDGAAEPSDLPDDLIRSLWKEAKSTDDRLTISAAHLTLPGARAECNESDDDSVRDTGFDQGSAGSPAPSVGRDSVPAARPVSPYRLLFPKINDKSAPGFDFFTTSEESDDDSPLVKALKRHYALKALAESSGAPFPDKPGRFKLTEDVDVDEFLCGVCDMRFPTRLRCERHVWGHLPGEDESFKCNVCGRMLSCMSALRRHHKLQHTQEGQQRHACEQCDKICESAKALAVHVRRTHHVRIMVHVCEYCNAMFQWRSKYDSHMVSVHQDDQETAVGLARVPGLELHCARCPDFVTHSDLELSRHVRALHSEAGTFQCKMCSLVFQDEPGREEHEKTVHVVEIDRRKQRTVYLCRICNKGITTLTVLAKHLRLHLGPREKAFLCPTCGLQLSSSVSLRVHMMLHEEGPPLQCPHCPMRLQNRIYLRKHIKRRHMAQLRYSCSHCGKKFINAKELPHHLTSVHLNAVLSPEEAAMVAKLRKYPCHLCPFEAYTKMRLARHMASHPEARWFKCGQCKMYYATKEELQAHLARSHKTGAPCKRPCKLCPRVFYSNVSYEAHMQLHAQGAGIKCSQCNQVFGTPAELGRHAQRHDASLHQQCGDCGRKFASMQSLQVHQRSVHEKRMKPRMSSSLQISKNGRQHECPLCKHHFVYPSSLQAHMVYKHDHVDSLPGAKLPCPTCGQVCNSEVTMSRHLRIQHGESPCACEQCNMGFSISDAAMEHNARHATSQNFKCAQCTKQFSQRSDLSEHIRLAHSMPFGEDLSLASDTGHLEVATEETAGQILDSLASAACSSTQRVYLVHR